MTDESKERLAEIQARADASFTCEAEADRRYLLKLVAELQDYASDLAVSEAAFQILVDRLQERMKELTEEHERDAKAFQSQVRVTEGFQKRVADLEADLTMSEASEAALGESGRRAIAAQQQLVTELQGEKAALIGSHVKLQEQVRELEHAAIERGIADSKAGRVKPWSEVKDDRRD